MTSTDEKRVVLGRIGAAHGVRGWVKVYSYTEPFTNLLDYKQVQLLINNTWHFHDIEDSRITDKSLLIKFKGCEDRTSTRLYTNALIAVDRELLPTLPKGEIYWTDLEGLKVVSQEGIELGIITSLLATGANDVMIVKGDKEHLIPYLPQQVVTNIDFTTKTMIVDWDVNF